MTVIEKDGLRICRFVWEYLESNMYLIQSGEELLVIDPADTEDAWQYIADACARNATVLLTHEHCDHISGLNRLRETMPCTVYAQESCSENIGSPSKNLSTVCSVVAEYSGIKIPDGMRIPRYRCEPAEQTFEDRMKITWHGHEVEMVATPGHSQGSACIVLDGKFLFSGDTLFRKPVVTRFPGGSTRQYREVALPRLKELERQIEHVFPGHWDAGRMDEMEWGDAVV